MTYGSKNLPYLKSAPRDAVPEAQTELSLPCEVIEIEQKPRILDRVLLYRQNGRQVLRPFPGHGVEHLFVLPFRVLKAESTLRSCQSQ